MLMMMIPGTDHTFWNDHQQCIAPQPPNIVDQEVHDEIDSAEHEYKKYRNAVRNKSEHKKACDQEAPGP